ncbi:MAG: DUF2891 domain-containing protein [Gemmatimonadaceae bacterium]|nr:DUF2891 domain-containing protein [Gemmatimonadaceae bacterium]
MTIAGIPSALTTELAARLARLALAHVEREYPHKLEHAMASGDDAGLPRVLHPVFFGSFDWHSCVHGYWLLATLLRLHPRDAEAAATRALFDRQLTMEKVAGEVAYFEPIHRAGFERPYGWAWLLMLAAELHCHRTDDAARWSAALAPLVRVIVVRFTAFVPKATYPTRVGTHFNSAFAIALALEYADVMHDKRFGRLLRGRATAWFANDADCQAWEPGGDDFLSSALVEAECMRRALGPAEFERWIARFLPRIAAREPATLFVPTLVSDRTDGKIAHLDGLNLSRAWCWRSLATAWSVGDPRRSLALATANQHLDVALPHVAGDYMGEHWLATFALLAILVEPDR